MTNNSNSFKRPFPTNSQVGRRIRLARKARGWTISEMAAIGGIKAVVIGSYERGSRNMPLSRLGEIAEVLNVDVEYLLGLPAQAIEQGPVVLSTAIIDLRALARPTLNRTDWLTQLVNFCAGVVKKRGDWNGEVLSLRASDLQSIAFAIGTDCTDFTAWLITQNYLITEIDRP